MTATLPGPKERIEEIWNLPPEEFEAVVLHRVAEGESLLAARAAIRRVHVLRRTGEVSSWPQGRFCPIGRLAEAWAVHRHGADAVAKRGAAAAGKRTPELARRAARATALYERFADERPPGWPRSGPAALCALAGQRRAAVLAGDIARLSGLAAGMRASALLRSAERLERAAARAHRRQRAQDHGGSFRTGRVRWETAEERRVRVRDEVLLAGGDPAHWPNAALAAESLARRGFLTGEPEALAPDPHAELDGVGACSARYRAEQRTGRWALPASSAGNSSSGSGN